MSKGDIMTETEPLCASAYSMPDDALAHADTINDNDHTEAYAVIEWNETLDAWLVAVKALSGRFMGYAR